MSKKSILAISIFISIALIGSSVSAQTSNIDDLKKKIEERNATIKDLEKEISEYQNQITTTGKETQSLQSAVKSLDLTQKKLATDIALTENRITKTNYSIDELSIEISGKAGEIDEGILALADTIRLINESDSVSFVERFLAYDQISEFTDDIERISALQGAIESQLEQVRTVKADLESEQVELREKQRELKTLQGTLSDQKKIVEYNKSEKNALLKETKNKEANYRKILAEKVALRDAFERELLAFESELQLAIDPSKLPAAGKGVLAWPLDSIQITQTFGMTAFAASGAYNGNGHNGVDFRAAVGTPVKSSGNGTVKGTGDTDTVCPGASYGKWVLIEHTNGLSTLYAHLSLIKVSTGDTVGTGQVIGYSGNTGYSTGPHLHYTVYATQGVRIMDRKSAVCGGTYTMPIADLKAYLNPLEYL